MRFIRVQDVALARQAVPLFAAKPKTLHARDREADRIRIVPVRREGVAEKLSFHPVHAITTRHHLDPIPLGKTPAQPFKTTRRGRPHHSALQSRPSIPMPQPDLWRPILTLLVTSTVIMGSPGPSTMSAVAVAAAYGFRRSLVYGCGLIGGTTAVLLAVAAGVVTILWSVPHAAPALLALSAGYILYLAWRIATAPPLSAQPGDTAAPAFGGGCLLAIANPKAYLAIAAVFAATSIFPDHPGRDVVAKTVLLTLMIVLIHLAWLLVGASLARALRDPTLSRVANILMALGLIVTTALTILG